jgi:Holliday junction DNA helicase RuvA
MIARIKGKIVELSEDSALIEVGNIAYEVMLPGYCVGKLAGSIGREVTLFTMEYYEGTPGGGNLVPRMVGFLSAGERRFFERITSVKGIGIKKGLRSLAMPIENIAGAIENEDAKLLMTMPGVGKRMAQQIIAELKGKVTSFAGAATSISADEKLTPFAVEALEILIAWGERRQEASELIAEACNRHPDVKTAEELVPLVYRLKQGIEV